MTVQTMWTTHPNHIRFYAEQLAKLDHYQKEALKAYADGMVHAEKLQNRLNELHAERAQTGDTSIDHRIGYYEDELETIVKGLKQLEEAL